MHIPTAVWITGSGCYCALGDQPGTLYDNLLQGRSGVRQITRFPTTDHSSRVAAWLEDLPTIPAGERGESAAPASGWERLAYWSASQALQEAGLWESRQTLRIGLVLGIGAEWTVRWEQDYWSGGRSVDSPQTGEEGLTQWLRQTLELSGPSISVAAACASGNHAIGLARRWLQQDWVDVCLAGACEYSVTPLSLACFGNMGALSARNDDPAGSSRPFDRLRDGFVLGEGGAFLVLEQESFARQRGASPLAEVAGFGMSSDAFHFALPSSDPEAAARAIRSALDDAGVRPAEIDYINAHAPSTAVGDIFETRALTRALGRDVSAVPISSTKSMTGHLLSAASAIEAVACVGVLQRQAAPPTVNLEEVDPDCAHLNHIRHQPLERPFRVVMSNAFGFGGANTSLVLRRPAA